MRRAHNTHNKRIGDCVQFHIGVFFVFCFFMSCLRSSSFLLSSVVSGARLPCASKTFIALNLSKYT